MTHLANAPATARIPLLLLPYSTPVPHPVSSGSLAAWQVRCTLLHIEANLETTLQASELARITQLSVSHFSRAFRISFGQPPHTYVMARRIEKAKRLILSDERIPLAEVALSCGLSDQAHLCRMFRKLVGVTPAAWRRKYWSPITACESPALPAVTVP
jgi:AraC family transcriptional regulator